MLLCSNYNSTPSCAFPKPYMLSSGIYNEIPLGTTFMYKLLSCSCNPSTLPERNTRSSTQNKSINSSSVSTAVPQDSVKYPDISHRKSTIMPRTLAPPWLMARVSCKTLNSIPLVLVFTWFLSTCYTIVFWFTIYFLFHQFINPSCTFLLTVSNVWQKSTKANVDGSI